MRSKSFAPRSPRVSNRTLRGLSINTASNIAVSPLSLARDEIFVASTLDRARGVIALAMRLCPYLAYSGAVRPVVLEFIKPCWVSSKRSQDGWRFAAASASESLLPEPTVWKHLGQIRSIVESGFWRRWNSPVVLMENTSKENP